MDFNGLEADFSQIRWPVPHHILAVNEDEEEHLFPLEGPLMNLPNLQMQDLGLLLRAQSLPPEDQGPSQILQLNLTTFKLPEHWPVYKEMTYLEFEEENQEVWEEQQDMEEEEQQEEDIEEEIIMTSNASQQGPVDVSLSTKRCDPICNDQQLLRDINSSAEPHISTIGLQDLPLPDATLPVFVPTLEPHHPQQ